MKKDYEILFTLESLQENASAKFTQPELTKWQMFWCLFRFFIIEPLIMAAIFTAFVAVMLWVWK